VHLEVVGGPLEADLYFLAQAGDIAIYFSPSIQIGPPEASGQRSFLASIPGSWLQQPIRLLVGSVPGTMVAQAIPVEGVYLHP
jgi:hypothetical protein